MKSNTKPPLPPLREVIARFELDARKKLGQHFLLDANITDKITRQAGDVEKLHIIEIGPGPGGLTRSLLNAGANVTAVEMDERCIAALNDLIDWSDGRLKLVQGDALETDLTKLTPEPRAVIANLPYNIATELLFRWLAEIAENKSSYAHLTLMFQKEVGDRIVATPGNKSYGRVSVLSQWLCETRKLFDLPARAFTPPPKVDSTIIQLAPREQPIKVDKKALEAVLGAGFQQRRKMLRAALKTLRVDTELLLKNVEIDPTLRAERLSVEEFCRLANAYSALNNG